MEKGRNVPWKKQELMIKMNETEDKNEDGDADGMETR